MDTTTKRFQCRHIFTDGHRCGSACLRHEEFCYYHHTTRRPAENPRQRRSRRSSFDLPNPENRSAIQCGIGEVLRRIASNDVDPRRAGLLLYGLQIASLNLPRTPVAARDRDADDTPDLVEEVVTDPTFGTLAPRAEVPEPERRQSIAEYIEERFATRPKDFDDPPNPLWNVLPEPTTPESKVVPTIQATIEAITQATPHATIAPQPPVLPSSITLQIPIIPT